MARAAKTARKNTSAEDSPESVKAGDGAEAQQEGAAALNAAPDQDTGTAKQNTREAEDSPEPARADDRAEAVQKGAAAVTVAPDQDPANPPGTRVADGGDAARAAAASPPEVPAASAAPRRRMFTARADILHDQEHVAPGATLALTEAQHGALRARVAEDWEEAEPEPRQG